MLRPRIAGTDILEAALGEIIVDTGGAAIPAAHLLEYPRWDHPFMQVLATLAQRVLDALVRAGAIAVKRNGEAANVQVLTWMILFI